MFTMFNQAFSSITVLFAALENIAKALFHLSQAAEVQAKSFSDEAMLDTATALTLRKREAAKQTAEAQPLPVIQAE
jgi:hypothetical protein